jgi:hypothetical protein
LSPIFFSDNAIFQPIKAYKTFDDDYISDKLLLYAVAQYENQQVSEQDPINNEQLRQQADATEGWKFSTVTYHKSECS